jgi:hypothetical protein
MSKSMKYSFLWIALPLSACTVTLVGYPRDGGSELTPDAALVDRSSPLPDRFVPIVDAAPSSDASVDALDGSFVSDACVRPDGSADAGKDAADAGKDAANPCN